MRCEEVKAQLLDVADGAEVSPALRDHLASCRRCSEHLAMLRRHRELFARVPSPPAPVELWGRIHQRIGRRRKTWVSELWWAAAAAVVLLAAYVSHVMLTPPPEIPGPMTPVAEVPMNGKSVDYLMTRHAVLQNTNILNAALVDKIEQNEYLTVAGDAP